MNVRFFTAIAIALTIFALNASASWAQARRPMPDVTMAIVGHAARSGAAVKLPEVVVRPTQAQLDQISEEDMAAARVLNARATVAGAKAVLTGRVRERVSRVSLLVPYYAFGGARLRATE
jgi:hypothetical protein